ncbi:DNA translocase FtsK [Ruficoccus amylovorans]|uniref:DNA translocase FtsK n=1 Tax=Ruficoccus amylovorans TaxID=1804625 RepID=A0A842HJN0_9BACT|nr:DNA translocase FtsK [Ruficoccus amylovorans]MBC2596330.1 DNA translocase FtsK [Ruficoccus amylovorans]
MGLFSKKPATAQEKTSFAPRKPQSKPFWALAVLALSVIYLVALLDFNPSQSAHLHAGAQPDPNLTGKIGAELAYLTFSIFGIVSWLIPLLLFWISYLLLFRQAHRVRLRLVIAAVFFLVSLTGLFTLADEKVFDNPRPGSAEWSNEQAAGVQVITAGQELPERRFYFNGLGGRLGLLVLNQKVITYAGYFGASLLIFLAFVVSSTFLFTDNIHQTLERLEQKRKARKERLAELKAARKAAPPERSLEGVFPKKGAPPKKEVRKPSLRPEEDVVVTADEPAAPEVPVSEEPAAVPAAEDSRPRKGAAIFTLPRKREAEEKAEEAPKRPLKVTSPGLKIIDSEVTEKARIARPDKKGNHTFPSIDLLSDPVAPGENFASPEEHQERARDIARILDEFNVKVEPAEVQTGPVITRYEVIPAPGVRVEKILNLDKNLALGLRAEAVRILAPVPGKGTVGIEVPNPKPLPVTMREIVESRAWAESKAEIPVVLGKDVTGKPIVEDLTRMPHMLIAGSTGSGKTVCINSVIASLLYHAAPEDLRFLMVDPKVVEMQVYNKLPHMLIPVVTEPKKVPGALKYLISEMERRYQIFAKMGVRNIAGFNAKIAKNKKERDEAEAREAEMSSAMSPEERAATANLDVPRDDDVEFEIPEKRLHYIVCIIDELADLMMVAPQDIETGIARLAQLARAAGIHLILATQRPSVNVITGVIKANLPTRVSFKVASKVDSRTILDQGGAEALIGKGDMLFVPPGTSNLVRAQGAFVSDDEINHIVDFLNSRNGDPQFAEEVQQQIEAGGEDGGGGGAEGEWDDELVPDAIEVLRATKRASTSMLQRRLKIGYNRAARIMEILEDEGIVGPENGSSPREILRDLDSL